MKNGFRVFLLIVPALFALDQFVKIWARMAAQGVAGRTIAPLWPGVFELKLVYNEGVAFGLMQGMAMLLTPVAVGIVAVSAWYSWKHPEDPTVSHVTAGLLASGALGNLIDRLSHGRVTDLFWIRLINFPVFNVADVCITLAGTLFVLGALREMLNKPTPREQDPATLPENPT